jgi:hypothetical protein
MKNGFKSWNKKTLTLVKELRFCIYEFRIGLT